MRIFVARKSGFLHKNLKFTLIAIFQILLLGFSSLVIAIPTVELKLDEGSAAELGQVTGSFTVTRTDDGNLANWIDVWLDVTGTAVVDADYSRPGLDHRGGSNFSVRIPAGDLARTITLTPVLDNIIESEEFISIQLQEILEDYTAPVLNTIEIAIADDVAVVSLKLEDGDMAELGQDPGSFTVTRSNNGKVADGRTRSGPGKFYGDAQQ